MAAPPQLASPARGYCSLAERTALTLGIPAWSVVIGPDVSATVLLLSAAAASLEVALWAGQFRKELRLLLRPARFAPFPLRLLALYSVQIFLWAPFAVPVTTVNPVLLLRRGGLGAPGAQQAGGARSPESPGSLEGFGVAPVVAQEAIASGRVGRDLMGRPFYVDADPKTLAWSPDSISVVLPCAEERDYALKTVQSVFEATPREVLHEIIVVDDGSSPPMSETHFTPEVQRRLNTKVLRHERTVGLIGAKKTGGDAATGDIIVFFDCHVAPQPGWHKAFLRLVGENYRRLVVPQITALDVDTWTQVSSGGGMSKCYLTWDADFKWFDSDDMYVAVISGGLLGLSRQWWLETGGYDEQMLGWGGENLDQSLRMWLCGGEIVAASDSFVAHMWRTGDRRTQARYRHVGDSSVNRARAVYAWYGEFAEKLRDYPVFNRRSWGQLPWYGNLSNILVVKERLKCRPFAWFLRRFKSLYEDAGLIPADVFMLREESSRRCLRYDGQAGTAGSGSGTASLASCDVDSDQRLYWHVANKNRRTGRCCSGIRAWNTDQCLHDVVSRSFQSGVCDVSGHNPVQEWAAKGNGELRRGNHCAGVENGKLVLKPCVGMRSTGTRWTRVASFVPLETRLYEKARKEQPEVFASVERQLSALATKHPLGEVCDQSKGGCFSLHRQGKPQFCLDDSAAFVEDASACLVFFYKESDGSVRLAAEPVMCLDRANDVNPDTWLFFPCHGGANQEFARSAAALCSHDGECLAWK